MPDFSVRRHLAAAASLATTAAVAIGGTASPADATEASPGGPARLTLSDGSGGISVLGGSALAVPGAQGTARDAAWAPDGSRVAYVDTHQNIVVEGTGGDVVTITPPAGGGRRARPTWIDGGTAVLWSELAGGPSSWVAPTSSPTRSAVPPWLPRSAARCC